MAALPSLPFRVGMDVYNWVEDKLERMNCPSMNYFYNRGIEFCRDQPIVGLFLALTAIITLGPLTLLVAFLLFTNTCLLLGFALIEFLIIAAGMSVFIPVFLVGVMFSVTLTSIFTLMGKIWMGDDQKINKSKKDGCRTNSGDLKLPYIQKCPVKIEDVTNKMTQTAYLIEETEQTRKGSCGQIGQVSFLTPTVEEVTNTNDYAQRIVHEKQ